MSTQVKECLHQRHKNEVVETVNDYLIFLFVWTNQTDYSIQAECG